MHRRRVADDAHVHVPAELDAFVRLLVDAPDELEQDAVLDVLVAVDRGRDRLRELVVDRRHLPPGQRALSERLSPSSRLSLESLQEVSS